MSLPVEILQDLYRRMLRIRRIEEEIAALYSEQEMRCPVHLSVGQEAIAVGVCSHLTSRDQVSSAHRSHGHYLAQGGDLMAMLSELYGKATGCCGGRGGSMHLIDRENGFLGAVPIVGSTLSIGVGFAWAAKLLETGARTAIFFGEGATEEGAFSESLNLACLHKLPVIFICEHNGFSVYTNLDERRSRNFSFAEFFKSHGADFAEGDGMDVANVYQVTGLAVERLRAKSTPQVLYFKTWRYLEHCGPALDDHLRYRSESELLAWRERDPLLLLSQNLRRIVPDFSDWEQLVEEEIRREIDETMMKVNDAPFPDPDSLGVNLWAGKV